MKSPTTPLGFLPGDIDRGAHCIFVYNKKDDGFVQNVVDFLSAGIKAGELCVCAVHGPIKEKINERMVQSGADASLKRGQVSILDSSEVYLHDGTFDTSSTISFWQRKLALARHRWKGLRIFGDVIDMFSNRATRLKYVEYEALMNLDFQADIALCGYQSNAITRSLLLQAKSVHPFIANNRSIRKNAAFLNTAKFLAGFYKFRRVSKEYMHPCHKDVVHEDFEAIAARTPLTMPEIEGMKAGIGEVFTNISKRINYGSDSPHVHITFAPESDKFLVILWYHVPNAVIAADPVGHDQLDHNDFQLAHHLMDKVHVERLNGDMAVTMVKKYSATWI